MNTTESNPNTENQTISLANKEGIDIVSILLIFVKYRLPFMLIIFIFSVGGLFIAYLTPSAYYSEALVAPKELKRNPISSSILSQMGGLGNMVVAEMGIGSNDMVRLEIYAQSHDLSETVIQNHQLMPRLYPHLWDTTTNTLKPSKTDVIPSIKIGAERLRNDFLKIQVDKKRNVLRVGIESPDSIFSVQLVNYYLEAINAYIREKVIMDADVARKGLESQLQNVVDPVLRDKINSLIIGEMEKSILVSNNSIDVLEKPMIPLSRIRPHRSKIMIMSFILGIVIATLIISGYVLTKHYRDSIKERWSNFQNS